MSVFVVPYSDSWPALFQAEAARLTAALAPWLVGDVEHIGSTAVPGLAAKPILDMLAPVAELDAARAAISVVEDLGYRHADHRPDQALWFYKQQTQDYDTRSHQLHLTQRDSALWQERLAFRDALRDDPALLAEYQDLKYSLAMSASDPSEYVGGKRALVRRVLASRGVRLD